MKLETLRNWRHSVKLKTQHTIGDSTKLETVRNWRQCEISILDRRVFSAMKSTENPFQNTRHQHVLLYSFRGIPCKTRNSNFFRLHVLSNTHKKKACAFAHDLGKRGKGGPIWSYDQLWFSSVTDTVLTEVCVNSTRHCATVTGNGCTRPDTQEPRRGRVVKFEGLPKINRSKTTATKS
jgi:hypothetical protein